MAVLTGVHIRIENVAKWCEVVQSTPANQDWKLAQLSNALS